MQVLSVASEAYPLIKTGGLADVAGALPLALAAEGVQVRTLIPGYPSVLPALDPGFEAHALGEMFGGPAQLLCGTAQGLDVLVLDAPHLFARAGNPYHAAGGQEWPDNAFRFAALGRAAADIGLGALPSYQPDIVHAHDWQAGLAPAYLAYASGTRPGTVITVHNLAFPGKAPLDLLAALGLPPEALSIDGAEFYGSLSLLKAGLATADRITTVSPTYAAEIVTPDFGMGFDGLLRARRPVLSGILNGIDTEAWNPASDALLATPYDRDTLALRAANKADLQTRFGLDPDPDAMLFGVISRLSWQKGIDLLLAALPGVLADEAQLVVLGAGEAGLEVACREAAGRNPGKMGVLIGYDEALAHGIQGGCDALLVPSRFEPCGLTQLCALRYGAVPVVARIGGLADTVIDANAMALQAGVGTGVVYTPGETDAITTNRLRAAMQRAMLLHADRAIWRSMQRNGMAADMSWRVPARHYANLYRSLLASR